MREIARSLAVIERTMGGGSATEAVAVAGLQQDRPGEVLAAPPRCGASLEEAFYRSLLAEQTPVHLRCRGGYEVHGAILRDAGTDALLIETLVGLALFLTRNILSIATSGASHVAAEAPPRRISHTR